MKRGSMAVGMSALPVLAALTVMLPGAYLLYGSYPNGVIDLGAALFGGILIGIGTLILIAFWIWISTPKKEEEKK
jgi:preprotein translocase subunit SecF